MIREIAERIDRKLSGGSDPKLEEELPYAAMMVTLMAGSGVSPYESFKKLRSVDTLERFRNECEEMVRAVEVLGYDPLTAMENRASESMSRSYSEFLQGYVSAVKSGGSVTSYLTSKLRGIFDVRSARAQNTVERLETLVEGYMIMLVVVFSFYIVSLVMSSVSSIRVRGFSFPDPSAFVVPMVVFVIPIFSLFFMYLANNLRPSTLKGMREPYKRGLFPGIAFAVFLAVAVALPQLSFIFQWVDLTLLVTVGLISISILPAITYMRIARRNFSAENAMPSFLRDITEARRTGLSPEKSIVHAAKRRGYGIFSEDLQRMVNELEWGVSLRKIYDDLKEWIRSWPVVFDFFVLVETIEIGGGETGTLGTLAEFSEKMQTIEKSTRDMLRPYIVLPFVWTILMTFTITFTSYSMSIVPLTLTGSKLTVQTGSTFIETCIVFQTWLSGFFIGKVSEGNFAAGFKHAALLAGIAYLTFFASRLMVEGIFKGLV